MLLPKRNSLALLCLMLACCQKIDLTVTPEEGNTTSSNTVQTANIVGTGEGTMERPYTVTDIRSAVHAGKDSVWVIGYMVGTAPRSMGNAVFSSDATNQSNILLSNDSLSTDTAHCIPVELTTPNIKATLSLPTNTARFRKCVLVKGIPSTYLQRKGLRKCSAGLWLVDFDLSSIEPQDWGSILL